MKYWSVHDEFSGHVRRDQFGEFMSRVEASNFRILTAFIWGRACYSVYHTLLSKTKPQKIMENTPGKYPVRKMAGKVLTFIFIIDDLFISRKKGRRIFLVAQKIDNVPQGTG